MGLPLSESECSGSASVVRPQPVQSFTGAIARAYYALTLGDGSEYEMPDKPPVVGPGDGGERRLRIDVLGRVAISCCGRTVTTLSRKEQAILCYLVLSDDSHVTRERLTSLLWSEAHDGRGRGSLRTARHEIDTALRAIGFDGFQSDRLSIRIPRDRLACDLWDLAESARRGVPLPLLTERSRVIDNMLADLQSIDQEFSTWLHQTRAGWHKRLVGYLQAWLPEETLPEMRTEPGTDAAAEPVAHALSVLEPSNEPAARVIIRACWSAGDVGTGLSTYKALWKLLDEEYGTEPSPETQALIARLKLEQPVIEPALLLVDDAAAEAHASGYDARPSIAVLPFQTLGPADDRYFGNGIVDDIIHPLAGLKDLLVIAKGSTQQFRDPAPDVRDIGRRLGVRYVLHGTVQRSGDRLRIHTSLADAETGEVIKPARYEGLLAELFDLQDQIALETAKFIAPSVRERELKRAMRKHPQSMTAYDLVLQAVGPLHDLDYAAFSRARTLLHRAIELDPAYAPAFSYAAMWHCYRIGQEWSTDIRADMAEAERLASSAIQLDSNDATALAVHAHVACLSRRDYAASRAAFERALEASPNSALAWTLSAVTESCAGNGAEAIRRASHALKLSPTDTFLHYPLCVLSQAFFVEESFLQAVDYGRLAFARNHRFTANLRILAASLVETGQLAEARDYASRHLALVPGFRLGAWVERTWLNERARDRVARHLRTAGIPD